MKNFGPITDRRQKSLLNKFQAQMIVEWMFVNIVGEQD